MSRVEGICFKLLGFLIVFRCSRAQKRKSYRNNAATQFLNQKSRKTQKNKKGDTQKKILFVGLPGGALVGLVDYVGKNQARVRLITDVGLKPSVRAVRGSLQNAQLYEHVESVLRHVQGRGDLPMEEMAQLELIAALEKLQRNLASDSDSWYLAKGILEGGGPPLWRSRNHVLKGIGFNYDFSDEQGPARPLLSKPPILQAHDLLVTTGLDGIFPAGLRVAEVSKVLPLKEGAYAYEIEAIPVVKNLDSIQTVFIIPSLMNEDSFTERDGAH
jgi:hypothetical protein